MSAGGGKGDDGVCLRAAPGAVRRSCVKTVEDKRADRRLGSGRGTGDGEPRDVVARKTVRRGYRPSAVAAGHRPQPVRRRETRRRRRAPALPSGAATLAGVLGAPRPVPPPACPDAPTPPPLFLRARGLALTLRRVRSRPRPGNPRPGQPSASLAAPSLRPPGRTAAHPPRDGTGARLSASQRSRRPPTPARNDAGARRPRPATVVELELDPRP